METSAAGAATGAVLMALTASFTAHMFVPATAKGRAKALRELLTVVTNTHNNLDTGVLPGLEGHFDPKDENFNMKKRSWLLSSLSSRLSEVEDKIRSAGALQRWSPVYLSEEIVVISAELETLHLNTMTTSKATNALVAKLMADPDANHYLYKDELMLLKDPPVPPNAVTGGNI